ncbi:MAG: HAMP domain-containing sensor histidine kinase, partial [Acidobacteriota bacterium]
GFVVVASDVTEQKRLEHIAVSLNMSDHLGMVFAGLRHELGNPVNSLKSAITVLRSGTLDEQRRDHYLDQMLGQIDRMEYLLEGLRSFSLFDRITIEAVDIGALFGRIDSLSRRDLEARNIDLHVHRPDDMVALANHQALLHVLLNLISNGATAVDDKADGFVRIKARASDDRIYIQVADNGVGINANDLDRIFTPFFTNRVGGTGLGLTIVKKLISSMHGTIDAMSTPGRGTTFTIVLDNHDYE